VKRVGLGASIAWAASIVLLSASCGSDGPSEAGGTSVPSTTEASGEANRSTTIVVTTTAAATSTVDVPETEITVTGSSVGPTQLGESPATVEPYLEDLLGPPLDRRRQALDRAQQECVGVSELAITEWSEVMLVFGGDGSTDPGDLALIDFRLGAPPPTSNFGGFTSANGAKVGDTAEQWLDLHPGARYFDGEPDLVDPALVLADGLWVQLDPDTERVVTLRARSPIDCE
jgi:hypothetical protein